MKKQGGRHNAFKLSMAVGSRGEYQLDGIHGRHFAETGKTCGLFLRLISQTLDELHGEIEATIEAVNTQLSADFPPKLVAKASQAALALVRPNSPSQHKISLTQSLTAVTQETDHGCLDGAVYRRSTP